MDDFTTQIDKFIVNTEDKLINVVRESVKLVVEEAQLEGPSKNNPGKGGKMRVDTGFMRSTGLAKIGSLPSGPDKGDIKRKYEWSVDQLEVILASFNIGDVFYFGWTANYARHREVFDGFLDSAVQNWQSHVDKSIKRIKK